MDMFKKLKETLWKYATIHFLFFQVFEDQNDAPTKTEKVSFHLFYCLNMKLNRVSLTKNAVAMIPKMAVRAWESFTVCAEGIEKILIIHYQQTNGDVQGIRSRVVQIHFLFVWIK